MKNRRLGRFRFGDYFFSWFSIVILLLFSVASLILKLSLLFVVFPLAYAIIWFGTILIPYFEQFSINGNYISVFWGKKTETIHLPGECTIIISYADVCPPLTVRTSWENQTHILKGKFAISILEKMPLEEILEKLHQNRISKYTTSTIKTRFYDRFIYSFVGNQCLFDSLTNDKKFFLIVPESLSDVIHFDSYMEKLYMDIGY